MTAVAYIRKSTKGGQDSKADQTTGARELAARHGDTDLLILDGDWAISAAREKTAKRLDFMRLLDMVERGAVTAVYATDADRLARSVRWAAQLGDACRDHGVRIHTPVRTFDFTEEADWTVWTFAAMTNEAEVQKMQRKAAARVTRQRERGSRLGQAPYGQREGESLQAVLDAFDSTGSYSGAARLLIEQGVPSRRSHLSTPEGVPMSWSASTVRDIIIREAPKKVPARTRPGSKTVSIKPFTRLLICPADGSYLTTQVVNRGENGYVCRIGHRSPAGRHPRPYALREHVVMGWIKQQVQFAMTTWSVREVLEDGSEVEVAEIEAEKERLSLAFAKGALSQASWESAIAKADARLDLAKGRVRTDLTWQHGIDWRRPGGEVNAQLRDLISGIRLGYVESPDPVRGRHTAIRRSLVPVGAIWRREPTIEVPVGNVDRYGVPAETATILNPDAVITEGGWYLADSRITRLVVEPPVESRLRDGSSSRRKADRVAP